MRTELIIVGGGITGASLARAARGLSIVLVAAGRPGATGSEPDSYDPRVYALSPGNVSFLRSIRVWDSIPPDRVTPVYSMRVRGDQDRASIEFDSYRAGVSELAWIVEDRELQSALWRSLADQDRLEVVAPAQCASLRLGDAAKITLQDGRRLEADLLVGADGGDSFVRRAAGIRESQTPYGQTAVVANFSCEYPHRNTAFQWFRNGPILALLPLPGNRVSMVWSLAAEEAVRVMTLDPSRLGDEVANASGGELGALRVISPPQSYPLRRLIAERMVLPHLALAGDAAHVIHPLAGQGLNLGLQDARVLGSLLAGRDPVRRPGDLGLLRRYERERCEPILCMRAAVHGLHALFKAESGVARTARTAGMNLTDRLTVLKTSLLRHALR